ncbi:beta/alpha barrel domain-containing protein [Edaphobacter flagellatus]|uniref:hypothetical protein n=1 Tax=Edaphobacter flagellatus TaxID=1933044 RepID=UPI0021B3DD19|nr:hypothetical protein [Edaphobacter flagellatus]
MQKTLATKLEAFQKSPSNRAFIIADAKDADMAFGIGAPGKNHHGNQRSLPEFRDQIREIVAQGFVDIMLMSASTSEILSIQERIFENSPVTPAVRANDTTDIHVVRGSSYAEMPSKPFSSTTIDHIQMGRVLPPHELRKSYVNLGLYSVTFNNQPDYDLATMQAYKDFRLEAETKTFHHFLEVFGPNIPSDIHRIPKEAIPSFVNDHIVRLLAGLPTIARPLFLKIPYYGPAAMEEICTYDPSLVVGVLGGSAGTTHDAFALLHSAKKCGARVALFGRKINTAEHQLSFIEHLRRVADDELSPAEAVSSYHGALTKLNIPPQRSLKQDMELTSPVLSYGK